MWYTGVYRISQYPIESLCVSFVDVVESSLSLVELESLENLLFIRHSVGFFPQLFKFLNQCLRATTVISLPHRV